MGTQETITQGHKRDMDRKKLSRSMGSKDCQGQWIRGGVIGVMVSRDDQ